MCCRISLRSTISRINSKWILTRTLSTRISSVTPEIDDRGSTSEGHAVDSIKAKIPARSSTFQLLNECSAGIYRFGLFRSSWKTFTLTLSVITRARVISRRDPWDFLLAARFRSFHANKRNNSANEHHFKMSVRDWHGWQTWVFKHPFATMWNTLSLSRQWWSFSFPRARAT